VELNELYMSRVHHIQMRGMRALVLDCLRHPSFLIGLSPPGPLSQEADTDKQNESSLWFMFILHHVIDRGSVFLMPQGIETSGFAHGLG
jgi:hypothetical protein